MGNNYKKNNTFLYMIPIYKYQIKSNHKVCLSISKNEH